MWRCPAMVSRSRSPRERSATVMNGIGEFDTMSFQMRVDGSGRDALMGQKHDLGLRAVANLFGAIVADTQPAMMMPAVRSAR